MVFCKKRSRKKFLAFIQPHPGCQVAMKAYVTVHLWARTLTDLGHEMRLIAPKFVKLYVKNRQTILRTQSDRGDSQPSRFVEVKTPVQQDLGMVFRFPKRCHLLASHPTPHKSKCSSFRKGNESGSASPVR